MRRRWVDIDRLAYESVRLGLGLPELPVRGASRVIYRWRWPSYLLIGGPIAAMIAAAGVHLLGWQ
jgi:hypothetical protein